MSSNDDNDKRSNNNNNKDNRSNNNNNRDVWSYEGYTFIMGQYFGGYTFTKISCVLDGAVGGNDFWATLV